MMDPSTASVSYQQMAEKWELPLALMGGTPAMLSHEARFLPRHPAENERVYRERVKRSVLRNYFRKCVQRITGRVFAENFAISDDMPEILKEYLTDVDLMGRSLGSFARDWFVDALTCGISYAYVDYPAKDTGGRPYAVHLKAEQIIAADYDEKGGKPELDAIRVQEMITERAGFTEKQVPHIRHITREGWSLYRRDERGHWHLTQEGEHSLKAIPLVALYTNRTGFMTANPPLEDLAYLNLEHFQIRSDQRNALNVASFPILAASGYDPEIDGPIEVGPNKVLTTSDTDGRYYYVESTGAALEAGARELQELEKAIHQFGMQLEFGGRVETATGQILEAGEAASPIGQFAKNVEEAVNLMIGWMARWQGIKTRGAVTLPFRMTGREGRSISDILSLYEAGLIDAAAARQEVRLQGGLPPT